MPIIKRAYQLLTNRLSFVPATQVSVDVVDRSRPACPTPIKSNRQSTFLNPLQSHLLYPKTQFATKGHTQTPQLQEQSMAKKSKILMLAPQPFFEPRGTPISVYQRLAALSSLGYQIDVLTYHIGQDVDLKGVTIHRTPPVSFIKQVKIGPSWAKLFLDILLFFVAIRLLIKNRYNVLHSHEEAAFMAMFLAKVFRISHLYDMHSSLPRQLQNFKFGNYRPIIRLFQFLEWRVLHTCDVLITIGADLEQFAKTVNPAVKQMRIENQAIHPDITVELPYSAAELKSQLGLVDKQVVVYTGTFERYQGLDLLLKSAKLVCNQQPDIAFVLVGGIPEQIEVYRKLAYDLGL
jgi:glycosyltransferase involved in cell wall biosynthesis